MSSAFNLTTFSNPPIQTLTINGANFVDGSNAKMRFWGANVVAFYPDKITGKAFAKNIAACGFNLVRWHHMMRPSLDWNWTSQIKSLSNYENNTSRAQPSGRDSNAWDRFDYMTSELYANGVYIMLSFDFTRTFLPGDVSILTTDTTDQSSWATAIGALNNWTAANWSEVIDKWRILPVIDERCALLQEEFLAQLLTRNNAYLGKRYGANEQVLGIEILNEFSSFYTIVNGNRFQKSEYPGIEYFHSKLTAKWNAYLTSHSIPAFDLYAWPANDAQHEARRAFLNKLDSDYRARIMAKVASLGFNTRVTFSNLWRSESDAKFHAATDPYSEDHFYNPSSVVEPMPYLSHFNNGGASPEPAEDVFYAACVQSAFSGKPFVVGEFNYSSYNGVAADKTNRAMSQLAVGAYGSLHDWSGVAWFAWNHGDMAVGADGWGNSESMTPSDNDLGGNLIQDAVRLDHFRTSAALFRNGLVAESVSPLTFVVDDPTWNSYGWPPAPKYKFRPGWQNKSKIRKSYGVKPVGQDASALMTQAPTNPIVSDTGQISKDTTRKQLTLSAPKAEGFSGALDVSAPSLLRVLTPTETSGSATCILVSCDGLDLTASSRLLLSRNRLDGSNWVTGPSLKLKTLKAATATQRWYRRTLRPRGASSGLVAITGDATAISSFQPRMDGVKSS